MDRSQCARMLMMVSLTAGAICVCAFMRHPLVLLARTPAETTPLRSDSPAGEPPSAARAALSRYADGILSDLFGRPPASSAKPAAPLRPRAAVAQPSSAPAAPDRLADYLYTGIVTVDGERRALVENRRTKQGVYLKQGDPFLEFTVGAITPDSITLCAGSQNRTLARNDRYDLVPLGKYPSQLADAATSRDERLTGTYVQFASRLSREKLLFAIGGEDVEHLRNEVFEGRMTQEEFDRRTSSTLQSHVVLSVSATGSADTTVLYGALNVFDVDSSTTVAPQPETGGSDR